MGSVLKRVRDVNLLRAVLKMICIERGSFLQSRIADLKKKRTFADFYVDCQSATSLKQAMATWGVSQDGILRRSPVEIAGLLCEVRLHMVQTKKTESEEDQTLLNTWQKTPV